MYSEHRMKRIVNILAYNLSIYKCPVKSRFCADENNVVNPHNVTPELCGKCWTASIDRDELQQAEEAKPGE